MKDKILKIKLIYIPFLLLSLGFIVIYTFLHWFLILKLQLFEIDEDIINYLIPFSVVWIPFVVIFKKRIKLLNLRWSKQGIDPLRISIAALATLIATSFAQDYIRTAAGELSQLNSVEQIDKTHLTKYYQFDKIYLVKKWREIYWFSDVEGKQMQYLDFDGYFVTPILSSPADTNKVYFSTWYAIKYHKRISNNLLKPEKDKEWQEFKTHSVEEFDHANLYKPIYFKRLGANLDQKRFLETIQFRNDYDHSLTPIILEPVDEAFELRNNDNLQSIIIFYGIPAFAMLFMILIPPFNEEELNRFKSKIRGVIDADAPSGTTKLLDKYSKLKKSESLVFKHANIEYTIRNDNFIYKISDNTGHIYHNGPYDDKVISEIMKIPNKQIETSEKSPTSKGDVYYDEGLKLIAAGNYEAALKSFEKALELDQAGQNELSEGASLSKLGECYNYLKNYPESKKAYVEAEKIYRKLQNQYALAGILINVGNAEFHLNNNEEARKKYIESIEISTKIGIEKFKTMAQDNLDRLDRL